MTRPFVRSLDSRQHAGAERAMRAAGQLQALARGALRAMGEGRRSRAAAQRFDNLPA